MPQLNLRVSVEEREEYDRLRRRGVSASHAALEILRARVQATFVVTGSAAVAPRSSTGTNVRVVSPAVEATKKLRQGMCPHRVPAGQYCKRCST